MYDRITIFVFDSRVLFETHLEPETKQNDIGRMLTNRGSLCYFSNYSQYPEFKILYAYNNSYNCDDSKISLH